jgi:hypothetical protein
LLGSLVAVLRQNLWNSVGIFVSGWVSGLAESLNLLQLIEAQFVNIFVEGQGLP